jgi:hypothetical protein
MLSDEEEEEDDEKDIEILNTESKDKPINLGASLRFKIYNKGITHASKQRDFPLPTKNLTLGQRN